MDEALENRAWLSGGREYPRSGGYALASRDLLRAHRKENTPTNRHLASMRLRSINEEQDIT